MLWLIALAALAQATDQGSAGDQQIEQISPARVTGSAPIDTAPPPARNSAVPQLNAPGAAPGPPSQLSAERDRAPVPQLYRGPRSAEGAQPLSRPEQGRTAATVRVEGADRCDPERAGARGDPACARVIETRSAEFTRPDPAALTPEQRLLAEQRLRDAGAMPSARRLAGRGGDFGSLDDQGIAAVALGVGLDRPPPKDPVKPDEEKEPANSAIINAIAAGLAGEPR